MDEIHGWMWFPSPHPRIDRVDVVPSPPSREATPACRTESRSTDRSTAPGAGSRFVPVPGATAVSGTAATSAGPSVGARAFGGQAAGIGRPSAAENSTPPGNDAGECGGGRQTRGM